MRVESGEEIVLQVLDMGFEAVELGYCLTSAALNEMMPLLGRDVQVASIHNFCPIPDVLPKEMAGGDAFLLSSYDREECERAVKLSVTLLSYSIPPPDQF